MARLLHFTDMHLRCHQPGSADNPARLCREMPAALDRLSRRIKEISPDVVVMTGDVLDMPDEVIAGGTPDARSHEEWMDDAKLDFQLVRDWFNSTSIPFVVIPGNHDHEGAFAQIFGAPPKPREIAGLKFFCFWDELADDRQPQRTGERKHLFENAMTDPAHDYPQIHVQHYMIDPPIFAKGWRYEYKGARKMKRDIERSGRVRAILSGHYHPGSLVTGNGVIHSLPPAFCEQPHAFRIYDIVDGSTTIVTDQALGV
jgi:hypothetical protein